jgi:tetratricopeptide (TPR) repeat protein
MTTNLVAAGLASLCVLLVLRPFANTRHPDLALPQTGPENDHATELVRQLRDLDEDLEAGKLDVDEHRRIRGPVEQQAAMVLRRVEDAKASDETRKALRPPAVSRRAGRPRARVLWPVGAVAVSAVAVLVLLSGALTPRGAAQNISGGAAGGSSSEPAGAAKAGAPGQPTAIKPTATKPTAAQVAAVNAATARVTTSPKSVPAHLDLAQAYTAAGSPQLSAIEYLAVLQLDPHNASANTQLALIAFASGQAAQAKKLADTALTAHHRYPEALYARGLIELMGLRHTTEGVRDLRAYLTAAPRGSHRASVETLLAIASGPAK